MKLTHKYGNHVTYVRISSRRWVLFNTQSHDTLPRVKSECYVQPDPDLRSRYALYKYSFPFPSLPVYQTIAPMPSAHES
jgi:hypothetical protein